MRDLRCFFLKKNREYDIILLRQYQKMKNMKKTKTIEGKKKKKRPGPIGKKCRAKK
jgi:hypothetical protein